MAKTKNTAALDMVSGLAKHQPGNHKDKMNPTMAALQSEDHKVLLDAIDKLRAKGVSQYVDLPQIVVCGDQSSGKSSVLQAVSNMSFPIKDNLCTRFATELVLRHIDSVVETCKITIQPGDDRTDEEKAQLNEFQHTCPTKDINIEELIEIAKGRIGLDDHSKRFSSDVLRIEVTGTTQPNLTIVDLPGLFRAGNKDQTANDAEIVSKLVQSYMTNPLSIILAVVSAKSDFALQEVTQLARKIDPHGTRTIGLITKPDTLDVGSDSERAYLDLAQNRDVTFRLGWHVLRNRDYKSRDSTNEERDQAEVSFFSQGVWAAVARKNKGVAALRFRLSEILTNHILKELPALLQSVETELKECSIELDKLGKPRSTISEQRSYLLQASFHFATIMKESITGTYSHAFFGSPFEPGGETKRLRAVVQSILADFATTMRVEGHAKRIVEKSGILNSREILRADHLKQVQSLMKTSKGCELPGTFNPVIVGDLFQEQSKPWQGILDRYSEKVLAATNCTVDAVLSHVVDVNTTSKLWKELVTPELEGLKYILNNKASEILASHISRHPITYNHYLTENVQKGQKQRDREKWRVHLKNYSDDNGGLSKDLTLEKLIDVIVESETEADMEVFAANAATDFMEAYYKVALKRVIDNFSDLVIEACLISRLPELFNPDKVSVLDDAQVECIAGESFEIMEDRTALLAKKNVVGWCLSELRRLIKHHQHIQRQRRRDSTTVAADANTNIKDNKIPTPRSMSLKNKTVPSTPSSQISNQAPAIKSAASANPTPSTPITNSTPQNTPSFVQTSSNVPASSAPQAYNPFAGYVASAPASNTTPWGSSAGVQPPKGPRSSRGCSMTRGGSTASTGVQPPKGPRSSRGGSMTRGGSTASAGVQPPKGPRSSRGGSMKRGGSTASTGGGLFVSSNTATSTTSTGFGGFGSTNNASTTNTFGGGSTGGGHFGITGTTTRSFGSGNAFNAPASTAFGAPVGDAPGTATTALTPTLEKESAASLAQISYQNIVFQMPYEKWSTEELRLADYTQNCRFGSGSGVRGYLS